MNEDFAAAMRRATQAVRSGRPQDATALIQKAVGMGLETRREGPDVDAPGEPEPTKAPSSVPSVGAARRAEGPWEMPPEDAPAAAGERRPRRPLGEVLKVLRDVRRKPEPATRTPPPVPQTPARGDFLSRSFASPQGRRDYRLYVPTTAASGVNGLIVMLHGCKQDPEDFATGTGMNAVAERNGLLVAYPGQTARANMSSCWNWFDPAHQRRGEGEPAIIAGMTQELMTEFGVDPAHVFVAGLSAGGAMAAVMAATYPEIYAAAGVHSGLAYRAASDVVSAFSAMRSGGAVAPVDASGQRRPRLIVFHGTADRTVSPANAQGMLDAAEAALPDAAVTSEHVAAGAERGHVIHRLMAGDVPLAEVWIVEGMGHGWSGGSAHGSFTDPAGPDASEEMTRFFLSAA